VLRVEHHRLRIMPWCEIAAPTCGAYCVYNAGKECHIVKKKEPKFIDSGPAARMMETVYFARSILATLD